MPGNLSYCGETVRKHDPDRFLLSLFAAPDVREDLWALYAFHYEIAKTREVVTNTQLGLIRLQWWRDALAAYYERGAVTVHQVMQPLTAAIKRHELPRELFDNLIFAREFDLEDRLPSNVEGMVKYAEFTAAPLTELTLRIQGITYQAEAVRYISAAYALTGILRAIPAHARQRRCYLPESLLADEGVSVDGVYDGSARDKLAPIVEKVVNAARIQLAGTGNLPKPLDLMKKLTEIYLDQIEAAGYNVFSPKLSVPPLMRGLKLIFVSLFNTGRKKP